jgi:hypothetical protein
VATQRPKPHLVLLVPLAQSKYMIQLVTSKMGTETFMNKVEAIFQLNWRLPARTQWFKPPRLRFKGVLLLELCQGSFWWKDCLLLDHLYKEHTTVDINNEKSCHLWTDNWLSSIREFDFPHLFSFAKNESISCREAWTTCNDNAYDMFNLPLSTTAHEQFHELQDDIQIMNTDAGNDVWNFPWGNSFSTKKVYNLLKGKEFTPTSILDIWKTCNIPRQKFFSWLLLQGRLNTKDMMSRKNSMWNSMTASYPMTAPRRPSCICSSNAISARGFGGQLESSGMLIWIFIK